MLIVEFEGLPSWSLDVSKTGESTKYPWPMLLIHLPLSTSIFYSPQAPSLASRDQVGAGQTQRLTAICMIIAEK